MDGLTPMSLYRYVDGKDRLIAVVLTYPWARRTMRARARAGGTG